MPVFVLENPGDNSQVTSPINISAQIRAQDSSLIRITLTDRSSTIIARQLLRLDTVENAPFDFSTNLVFEIPRDTSEGLLSIALLDSYNRPVALRSASLSLLSGGEGQIEASKQREEWLTISQPQPGEMLGGGEVRVTGSVEPLVGQPVFFELVTDSGGQIGTRQLPVGSAGEAFSFDISIPYAFISETRDVLLIIRQSDTKFGENIILDSVPIFLSP